jgi:hypothetical protein
MTYIVETKDGKSIPCDLYIDNRAESVQHESDTNYDGYHLYDYVDGQRLHKTFIPLDNVSEIKSLE